MSWLDRRELTLEEMAFLMGVEDSIVIRDDDAWAPVRPALSVLAGAETSSRHDPPVLDPWDGVTYEDDAWAQEWIDRQEEPVFPDQPARPTYICPMCEQEVRTEQRAQHYMLCTNDVDDWVDFSGWGNRAHEQA